MNFVSQRREPARPVYYDVIFEVEKEIPAYIVRFNLCWKFQVKGKK
jgi:hypothetical protein